MFLSLPGHVSPNQTSTRSSSVTDFARAGVGNHESQSWSLKSDGECESTSIASLSAVVLYSARVARPEKSIERCWIWKKRQDSLKLQSNGFFVTREADGDVSRAIQQSTFHWADAPKSKYCFSDFLRSFSPNPPRWTNPQTRRQTSSLRMVSHKRESIVVRGRFRRLYLDAQRSLYIF